MARALRTDRDYRNIIIPRWVKGEIEAFRPPSPDELAAQSRQFVPLIHAYLPSYRESAILELGCGFGGLLRALVDEGYRNLKAIDLIPECCAFVKEHVGVEPRCVDLLTFLAEDEGSYDVLIAVDVIEHFTKNEIVSIVERLYEVLKPGGIFIMRVPNGGSLGGIGVRYAGFTHETAFTPGSINELFRALGFEPSRACPIRCSRRGRSRARSSALSAGRRSRSSRSGRCASSTPASR